MPIHPLSLQWLDEMKKEPKQMWEGSGFESHQNHKLFYAELTSGSSLEPCFLLQCKDLHLGDMQINYSK